MVEPIACPGLVFYNQNSLIHEDQAKMEKRAMNPERPSQVWMSIFMLVLLAWSPAVTSFASEAQPQGGSVNWRLTDGRVVYPGDTLTVDRSTLMTGYMVEAVVASSSGPIRKGLFRATLTAFSPVERRAGQNPDLWYVAGKWTITATTGDAERSDFRRDGVVLEGNLAVAESLHTFAEQGVFGAPVRFLMTLRGECPGRGEGVFLGDEGFEGHIHITFAPGPRN
jgi:hypothetical protein